MTCSWIRFEFLSVLSRPSLLDRIRAFIFWVSLGATSLSTSILPLPIPLKFALRKRTKLQTSIGYEYNPIGVSGLRRLSYNEKNSISHDERLLGWFTMNPTADVTFFKWFAIESYDFSYYMLTVYDICWCHHLANQNRVILSKVGDAEISP